MVGVITLRFSLAFPVAWRSRHRHWQWDSIWCYTLGIHLQHVDLISFWSQPRRDGSPSIAQTPEPTVPKRGDPAPSPSRTAPTGEVDAEARWTNSVAICLHLAGRPVGLHSFCKLLPVHHISKLEESFTDLYRMHHLDAFGSFAALKLFRQLCDIDNDYSVSHQSLFSLPSSCGGDNKPNAFLVALI